MCPECIPVVVMAVGAISTGALTASFIANFVRSLRRQSSQIGSTKRTSAALTGGLVAHVAKREGNR
jgi:hypothetical protein